MGNGIVAGSLTPSGRWLSLGIAHPDHGRVVITNAPAFDEDLRRKPAAVRAYRAWLASREREGFGLALLEGTATASLVEDTFPLATHIRPDARIEAVALAPERRRGVVQIVRVDARRDMRIEPAWTGTMRLARAAYTQLTEGGPLATMDEHPALGNAGRLLWIVDEGLGAAAAVALPLAIEVPAGESETFAVAVTIDRGRDEAIREAIALAGEARALMREAIPRRRALWTGADVVTPARAPQRRALAYAADCASCEVDDGSIAVLADHEILPLIWTRDAYYVCRALLAIDPQGLGKKITAGFIRWCFETAERPGGWWPRASLATGQPKDRVFQLDQQLYPALLLADHARLTGDDALVRRYAGERDRVLRALLDRRTSLGLLPTEETPADDQLGPPLHFSSHVLLWHVLRALDPRAAEEVRVAASEHFWDGAVYAYAIGGPRGEDAMRYHDANDLPTVFAPGWGFCTGDDPRWRATIAFAWSTENEGFVDGKLGGLGSVHTLHPWPLGDLQDIVVGRVLGDRARVTRARARLRAVRMWDGMLPEAYDESTGAVVSRHWFAWPIALWALLEQEPALIAP